MGRYGKLIGLIAALGVVPVAQADWEGNWLLGVMGGYAARTGNLEVNIAHPAPLRAVTPYLSSLNENGFMWGLLGGFQLRCNSWLLGGELNIDWRNLDEHNNYAFTTALNTGATAYSDYDQNTVVGITARIGYEVTPCFLPYMRLGVETSNDQLTVAAASGTLEAFVDGSRRQYRFVGGVGAEMPVPALAGLSFRLEYNFYSKGKGVDASGFASDNLTFVDASASAKTNAGKAALVYNFM